MPTSEIEELPEDILEVLLNLVEIRDAVNLSMCSKALQARLRREVKYEVLMRRRPHVFRITIPWTQGSLVQICGDGSAVLRFHVEPFCLRLSRIAVPSGAVDEFVVALDISTFVPADFDYSHCGNLVTVGSTNGTLVIYHLTEASRCLFLELNDIVDSVLISKSEQFIVATLPSKLVLMSSGGKVLCHMHLRGSHRVSASFTSGDDLVAHEPHASGLFLLRPASGEPQWLPFQFSDGKVHDVEQVDTGPDGSLVVWDAATQSFHVGRIEADEGTVTFLWSIEDFLSRAAISERHVVWMPDSNQPWIFFDYDSILETVDGFVEVKDPLKTDLGVLEAEQNCLSRWGPWLLFLHPTASTNEIAQQRLANYQLNEIFRSNLFEWPVRPAEFDPVSKATACIVNLTSLLR